MYKEDRSNVINDNNRVGRIFLHLRLICADNPSPTRHSRFVLIDRLFMFNAAWHSGRRRKFSKLSDRNRWTRAREL